MRSFLCMGKPRSWKAEGRPAFQQKIRDAFVEAYGKVAPDGGDLYGCVYYLKNSKHMLDADNLSKPVWDALTGLAFEDDVQVLFRQSGILDMRSTPMDVFDLSALPDQVANQLIDSVGVEAHVVYIEVGPNHPDLYRFGLSKGVDLGAQ